MTRSLLPARAAQRPAAARLAALMLLSAAACVLLRPTPARAADAPALGNAATQTDGRVDADLGAYKAQQDAIRAVNDTGKVPLASYGLSKAQCWLDVSVHEYTQNDRSAFPQQAFDQSRAITGFFQRGGTPGADGDPALATPLVNGAAKVRGDLWQQVDGVKQTWQRLASEQNRHWLSLGADDQQRRARCGAQQAACAEVELVHAGNELNQGGWRQARPYIQIAEDYVLEARQAVAKCEVPDPPPCPTCARCPEPEKCVAPPPPVFRTLALEALFDFDRATLSDAGQRRLNELVAELGAVYTRIDEVMVTGHTDWLGSEAYNLRLSRARAEAVRSYLESHGVKAAYTVEGKGASVPVKTTCGRKDTAEERACLQPNRRVEVRIRGESRALPTAPQK